MSESGCRGFEDVQDVIVWLFVGGECCICLHDGKENYPHFFTNNH
jgi:hypothetical protein